MCLSASQPVYSKKLRLNFYDILGKCAAPADTRNKRLDVLCMDPNRPDRNPDADSIQIRNFIYGIHFIYVTEFDCHSLGGDTRGDLNSLSGF